MSQAGLLNAADSNPQIPINFVTDNGTAQAVDNTLNVFGGTDISTSGSGNTITITFTGGSGGFIWTTVTSSSPPNPIQIVHGTAYICRGVSLVTFLLPLAPNIGDGFKIVSASSRFQINQNGSQTIRIGSTVTTAGSGTVTSNTIGDFITVTYMGNNEFIAEAPQGTLTFT